MPPVEVFVSCLQERSLFASEEVFVRASEEDFPLPPRRALSLPPRRALSLPPEEVFILASEEGLVSARAEGEGLVCPRLVRGLCNALSGRAERWVPPGASPFLPRPKDPEAGAPRRYPHHLRLFFVRGVNHTKTDRDTARPAPLELGRS